MRFCLTGVIYGCTIMTYGSRQRRAESRAAEPCSRLTAADRSTARGRRAVGSRLFHFLPASLSIPATSAKVERTSSGERAQAGVHGQAPTQLDSASAVACICQENLNQRSRESSAIGVLATRGRSWLSRSRSGHGAWSWNIDLTACYPANWLRHISCWCRPGDERSENPHKFLRR
jgi:hypothetical protein